MSDDELIGWYNGMNEEPEPFSLNERERREIDEKIEKFVEFLKEQKKAEHLKKLEEESRLDDDLFIL